LNGEIRQDIELGGERFGGTRKMSEAGNQSAVQIRNLSLGCLGQEQGQMNL